MRKIDADKLINWLEDMRDTEQAKLDHALANELYWQTTELSARIDTFTDVVLHIDNLLYGIYSE